MEMVKTRHDKITNRIEDYPSFCNLDRKIHVNDAYNLRFFCMIGTFHQRPPVKGVDLCMADSHTGNHLEDDFTPLETIQRSYSVIRERISFELEGETIESGGGGLKTSWEYRPKRPLIYHRGQEMDFRSFMIQGVNGEFNFLPEGGFDDNQGSFFVKSVNNETLIIDAEPISVVLPANVADNIVDSSNTSSDDELPPVHPATSSLPEASKVVSDAPTPLDETDI
ncbi:hypothetical protein Tco_0705670, partial [Tanacetum coccineum]